MVPEPFPWGPLLAAIGIVASLGFNVFNYVRTSTIRRDSISLDEFRRLRIPVDAALLDIRNERANLSSLEASDAEVDEWEKLVAAEQAKVVASHEKLLLVLEDLDVSAFADGENWSYLTLDEWDRFSDSLDAAYTPGRTIEMRKQALSAAAVSLDRLVVVVKKRIDHEINERIDSKKGSTDLRP